MNLVTFFKLNVKCYNRFYTSLINKKNAKGNTQKHPQVISYLECNLRISHLTIDLRKSLFALALYSFRQFNLFQAKT